MINQPHDGLMELTQLIQGCRGGGLLQRYRALRERAQIVEATETVQLVRDLGDHLTVTRGDRARETRMSVVEARGQTVSQLIRQVSGLLA